MMPGMDGFELLSRIRERPEHASTPALFLTAKDGPTDRVSGLALGADDYVAKPVSYTHLTLPTMRNDSSESSCRYCVSAASSP